ncbi:MAG: hypothetical protein ABSH20_19110 [Tepidisphaeraceae bacterium]|jgi:uncharacterized membrane protein
MTDFLLKLFGIDATDAGHVSDLSMEFHGVHPAWVILFALVLAAAVFWMYRKTADQVPLLRRSLMTVLRAFFLALILGMLLQPVLSVTYEQVIRRTMLLLIDSSGSMSKIPDQRSEADDIRRLGLARGLLDPAKGLNQAPASIAADQVNPPRIEVVKAALKNPRIDLLPRLARQYDIDAYEFDRTLRPIPGASYTQPIVVRHDDLPFLLAYPWFVPGVIGGVGVLLILMGFVSRSPFTRYGGLGACIVAVAWGLVAGFMTPPPTNPAVVTTQPASDSFRAELETKWIDKLNAEGSLTAIGDAVRGVISKKRGQPIAGVLLVTDGVSNSGVQPASAASLAGQDRVPLYVYGVGITSPKDIIVAPELIAQDVAFAKDDVPVAVRVRGMGMTGQSAMLTVRMGEDKVDKEVTFNGDGEQIVTVALTPQKPGNYTIEALIPPREDEVVKTNNSASKPIRVIDGKIKVLYVEQYPRWEFKYVQAALVRDRRIDFKCLLIEADPTVARGKDSPYLEEFPVRKEDLFKYDCIVIGDVDPKFFSPTQMEAMGEFVSRFGGAIVMVAGKRYAPNAYRRTLFEKMLPVELESDTSVTLNAGKPVKLELTPAGKSSQMLRLSPKELDSFQKWAAMPAIYWLNKVARAKPAAEVLLVDPDPANATRYGKMPVLAIQQYGMGQVMYMGTDNFWRWRKNAGDKYHSMLWGQITQRLALPHLLGASKRTHLMADAKRYNTGDPVTVYARLYSESFEPFTEQAVRASFRDASGTRPSREVILKAIPEQPGMYRGVLVAPEAGNYKLAVEHDKSTALEFEVADPDRELVEPAMNKVVLEQMAKASGGQFLREEDLFGLPEKVAAKVERKLTTREAPVVYTWAYFLLMMSVVTAEWIVRKTCQLK